VRALSRLISGVLVLWADEVRVVASGRRHLLRRIVNVGLVQSIGLRLLAAAVPGFDIDSWQAALLAVVTIAIANAGLWPILLYLTLPLTVLTFGLFSLALNIGLLTIAAHVVPGIRIEGTLPAIWAALGLTLINTVVSVLFDVGDDEAFSRQVLARAARRRSNSVSSQKPDEPGLVVIQIDGLSWETLRFAARTGLMPTLARWIRSGSHRLLRWECGLPSQTSASQAGILYGDNWDIPAFRWYEKERRRLMVSNRPPDAAEIERRLSQAHGLLAPDGSSITNLLAGGAARSALTVSALGNNARPGLSRDLWGYRLDPFIVSRALVLMLWEMLIEVWQARRQRLQDVQPRVDRGGAFPLLRAVSCVLLRDLTTTFVVDEIYSGTRIVYADYVAYDELAHHAGPERPEALATLAELDRQISTVERATRVAPRPYVLVVLSDHGQTQGAPFRQQFGLTLEQLIRSFMGPGPSIATSAGTHEGWGHLNVLLAELVAGPSRGLAWLLRWLLGSRMHDGQLQVGPDRSARAPDADVVVCASGNLGLVYFTWRDQRLTCGDIEARYPGLIAGLATHDGIGLVLVRAPAGAVVVGRHGRRHLETDEVEGDDPLAQFGSHVPDHLRRLDQYPHVGDLVVISRIQPTTDEVAAFEELVGSHGGLGGPQTEPFLLIPHAWRSKRLVGAPAVYEYLRARLLSDAPDLFSPGT
jgi:uncharacterized membrane protein YvlD (DUF360 family)